MIPEYHQFVKHCRIAGNTVADSSSSTPILSQARTLVNPNMIPRELWNYRQFVCWRYEPVPGRAKPDKKPTNPITLGNAGSTYKNTWSDIRTAVRVYQENPNLAGIGFVVTDGDPYVVIDLDDCLTDSNLSPLAGEIVNTLATYTEVSPSGRGLRLIVRYPHPVTLKRAEIEIYHAARWVTLTGNGFWDRPIADVGDLTWLISRYPKPATQPTGDAQGRAFSPTPDDAALWDRMFASRAGDKIRRLYDGVTADYPTPSNADLALCARLLYWTGGDLDRVDRMFRQSGLYRPARWDKPARTGETYGAGTIKRARSTQVYTGGVK